MLNHPIILPISFDSGRLEIEVGFRLPSDVYFIDHVPVLAQWNDFLIVAAVTILITLGATLVPSWEAARLKPMQIIRNT